MTVFVVAENIFKFLLMIIETQEELIIWSDVSYVGLFNIRLQVSYAVTFCVTQTASCVWMVEKLRERSFVCDVTEF